MLVDVNTSSNDSGIIILPLTIRGVPNKLGQRAYECVDEIMTGKNSQILLLGLPKIQTGFVKAVTQLMDLNSLLPIYCSVSGINH